MGGPKPKCACKNHTLAFALYGIAAVCGYTVGYASCFSHACLFRIRLGKPFDPNGKNKARINKAKARKDKIAVESLSTAVTVREDPTQVMVANATRILAKTVSTLRLEVNAKIAHHVFRTATGSASYVGMDVVQTKLERSSLDTKLISDRRKNGRKGSIVKTNYNEHGFNFSQVTAACIVHNPSADVDDRYPNASLWSRTLPVDRLIFENDVKKGGLHHMDTAIAAAAAPGDYRDEEDDNDKEEDNDKNRDYETENYKKQRKI